jgi:gamma-glutamyltranspeptidase / glutathione hydrolase
MRPPQFTSRCEISGTFGVVASSHWIASQVGMALLESGGNAFDAAVAAGFTMQVAEPHQNSIGGEAVIMMYEAGSDEPRVVCGQGVAPAAATIARYRGWGVDVIPSTGLLPAVVPGAFDAWLVMLRDYGTRKLADVLTPAIEYARNGMPLVQEAVDLIEKAAERFRTKWTSSAAVYLQAGRTPNVGELFSNPVLADTYSALLDAALSAGNDRDRQIEAARESFYCGFIADQIDRFVANPIGTDGQPMCNAGLLTADDIAGWRATYERPVCCRFHGLDIYKPGPWTQGPVLLQVLALIRNSNLFDLDPFGAEYVHTLVEAVKLAFADREAWYGDSNVGGVPIDALLSEEYNERRRTLITSNASKDFRPGRPSGRTPRLPKFKHHVSGGLDNQFLVVDAAAERGAGDTCHIDVIDRHGNMVAATPSGGWLYGSPTIPELGFALSTRGQMFWLQEGIASALMPGTRPRTTLSPTIALDRKGDRAIAIGSRGADYQDQWIGQAFLRHVGFDFDLQSAVDSPMFQCDHWPRSDYPRDATPCKVSMDDRFTKRALDEMRERGHDVRVPQGKRWGRVCAARKNGSLLAAAASFVPPHFLAVGR